MEPVLLPAINQSQLKTWRRCQKEWDYKYGRRLVPRQRSRALFLGSWVHACLETHYRDGDWRIGNDQYLREYNQLFDEEKSLLDRRGKLPDIVRRVLRSYFWYYKNDGWKVYSTEQIFDVTFHGVRFKGRIDLIVEDANGDLWVVDHKTASTIPLPSTFHAMDPQLILYPWAAKQMWGLEIRGVMYNYVKSKPPSIPTITKAGAISRRRIVTDYPTLLRFLKANNFDPSDFSDTLRPMRNRSDFLRRYKLPREPQVVKRILQEALWTGREIYDHTHVIRNITKDCERCPYKAPCRAELNGLDTTQMLKRDFQIEEETYLDDHGTDDTAEHEAA